jgi:HEAT repeat protein
MMKATLTKKSKRQRATRASWYAASSAFVLFSIAATIQAAAQESPSESFWSGTLLIYGVPIFFVVFLIALVVYRRKSNARANTFASQPRPINTHSQEPAVAQSRTRFPAPAEPDRQQRVSAPQSDAATPDYEPSAFGAYRIDQEVGKLLLGKPHRMDVMASRVPDDRRAIEASLIKALGALDIDDEGRQRARQALEEYGFVARQSAVLLQGRDAWERSSAARVLGQVGSAAALPSLIEALHDADSVVRNQAVTSLGQLKQPAAIGALLDIARRHSDIPPSLLSKSLSACSVDSLGYLDSISFDVNQAHASPSGEPHELEALLSLEELPMGDEDSELLSLLTKLESQDAMERSQFVRELGLHKAQRSVSALSAAALHDSDTSVRSAAVTALGAIDHESVFAPVLIALADEMREVRAAAARTLSGLHFDRADAYIRVIETADKKTLKDVAQACIQTGIVAQAVDRLASEDRRQAHEAFSLFSLLTKAGETQVVFDVIENHKDLQVRLCAVRVLGVAGRADTARKLREVVAVDGMPEDLRTNILEVLYKLDKESAVAGIAK